jgi:hypothetical protein
MAGSGISFLLFAAQIRQHRQAAASGLGIGGRYR